MCIDEENNGNILYEFSIIGMCGRSITVCSLLVDSSFPLDRLTGSCDKDAGKASVANCRTPIHYQIASKARTRKKSYE